MIRKIIIPLQETYILQLPTDFIGKKIEVLVFELDTDKFLDEEEQQIKEKEARIQYLRQVLEKNRVDLKGYRFDRNEANEYE